MNVLRIGVRSIWRNPKRTVVTTAAMAFAGFISIFYGALVDGMMATLERNAYEAEIGELQVHAPGYRDDPDLYTRFDPDVLTGRLEAVGFRVAPRLYAFGLAAAGVSSAGVEMRGVDVAREPEVTSLARRVADGAWLDAASPRGVVLGRRLAKTLRVGIGDEVVVLGQAADGSIANDLFQVRGVLKAVSEAVDRAGFLMVEDSFRSLFGVSEGVHELALAAPAEMSLSKAARVASEVAPDLEIKTWRELQPLMARMLDTSFASQLFMTLITYAAVAMVVLNAALMSVFERIREFGVMKALGVGPVQIAGVIMVEVITQAALASLVAIAAGVPTARYFETHGMDLSQYFPGTNFMGVAFDPVWYCRLTVSGVLTSAAVLVTMAGLAAAYPGIKAALIRPVEALRHR